MMNFRWLWRNWRNRKPVVIESWMPAAEMARLFAKPRQYGSIVRLKLDKWKTRAAWKQTLKRTALCCICGNPLRSTVADLLAGPAGLPACVNCRELAAKAKALEKA